jgi:hypothetical protein
MPTAVETAVMETAMMFARMSRVTAVKTSLVGIRMMRLAVCVLALTPSRVLDRTALARRSAGAFSGGGSFPVDNSVDQESRESFPPLGIWSSHELPNQATHTRNKYDAENNQENREQHDLTLLLL